ncbi:MAG: (d)CMP kinase [Planctomycetaceae bacterium]|nr:(d)CMP kinase [Planctomycetaceae bacterium]
MIITIDGPAGAGKSSVAKRLAARLGFDDLDTGAMYRAVALCGLRNNVDWDQPEELVAIAERMQLRVACGRTFVGDEDVSSAVRSADVTEKTRLAANNPAIRAIMVRLQQEVARGKNIVTEGRDQGTAVFPDAECKIYLTATPEERARRRVHEFGQRGEKADYDEILRQINRRDADDMARNVGPLCEPADAVRVVTDGMTIDQVVAELVGLVESKRR